MSNHMNINVKSGLILGTLIVVALLAALWASSGVWFSPSPFEHRPPPQMTIPGDIEFYYTGLFHLFCCSRKSTYTERPGQNSRSA
jgi:hypothetical protein